MAKRVPTSLFARKGLRKVEGVAQHIVNIPSKKLLELEYFFWMKESTQMMATMIEPASCLESNLEQFGR